ncbi:ABA4-like family protein [Hyphococcus luteus]|uniref:DUF4281 domain-containing protein n=1 Tax=Hyphococcus luteus TaxID=2058213 RepID=A0A2S7K6G5_9PROT|nr:ABA4-like family protein [Marinicaulis flavus]PQA88069.1 DUF4281 domain-containing protein [Marinicaulis flavus]
MDWNTAFSLVNAAVLPGWALLVFLPKSKLTAAIVHSLLYPVLLGSVYAAGMIAAFAFGQSSGGVDFTSIEGVQAIFAHPNGVIIGWTHYLVFDLFVGAWIGRDAIREKLPHLAVAPCLIGAFMVGPLGLLAYILLRLMLRKKISLTE